MNLTIRLIAEHEIDAADRIYRLAKQHARVIVDLRAAPLIDHTTQERLRDLEVELRDQGLDMSVRGIEEGHDRLGTAPTALRKLSIPPPPAPTAP